MVLANLQKCLWFVSVCVCLNDTSFIHASISSDCFTQLAESLSPYLLTNDE